MKSTTGGAMLLLFFSTQVSERIASSWEKLLVEHKEEVVEGKTPMCPTPYSRSNSLERLTGQLQKKTRPEDQPEQTSASPATETEVAPDVRATVDSDESSRRILLRVVHPGVLDAYLNRSLRPTLEQQAEQAKAEERHGLDHDEVQALVFLKHLP